MKKTEYWQKLKNNKTMCTLCPHFCKLSHGARGRCFVRANDGDEIVLTTYGKSTGFAIDPIEKKPLNHFLPGSKILSFGTAGCNLSCDFCQNWHMSRSKRIEDMAVKASPEQIAKAAKNKKCRSVAFTYNDPIIFLEYAVDTAKACHDQGVKTVAVTAGYINKEPRKEFFKYMNGANVDLKAFTEKFYMNHCKADLKTVLETLLYIKKETSTWLEITTLLIPNENDSDEEIHALTKWVANDLGKEVPLHFSAFHPDFKLTHLPRTSAQTLKRAREIAIKNGLYYVYTGNISDKNSQSTYCHNCHKMIIERDGYGVGEVRIKEGKCEFCGAMCVGVY